MDTITSTQLGAGPVSKLRYHARAQRLMVLFSANDTVQIWQATPNGRMRKIGEFESGGNSEHRFLDGCWHPDGNSVALVGLQSNVEILSVPDGAVLAKFGGTEQSESGYAGYSAVAFSTSGDKIAASSIGKSRTEIYAHSSGELLGKYEVVGMQTAIARHPAVDLLANAMMNQGASLLRFSRIQPTVQLYKPELNCYFDLGGAVFSPDGSALALIGGRSGLHLHVQQFPTLRNRFRLKLNPAQEHEEAIDSAPHLPTFERVVFSPNASALVCPTPSGDLVELDAVTGGELNRWQAHVGPCTSLELDVKQKLLFSAGVDGALRVWHSNYVEAALDERSIQRSADEFSSRTQEVDPFAHWSDFEVIEA